MAKENKPQGKKGKAVGLGRTISKPPKFLAPKTPKSEKSKPKKKYF